MNLRKAAQQALDEMLRVNSAGIFEGELNEAIDDLRAALAEPEQEMPKQKPVAWTDERGFIAYQADSFPRGTTVSPLYAHPPTPRKPLSEAMKEQCPYPEANPTLRGAFYDGWLRAETAHGITGEQP